MASSLNQLATILFTLYSITSATPRILLQAPPLTINPPPGLAVPAPPAPATTEGACTQDIMTCPDGSYVSRVFANGCAFEPCPVVVAPLTTSPPVVTTSAPLTTKVPMTTAKVTPSPTEPVVVTPAPTNPVVVTPVPTTPAPTSWVLPPGRVIPPLPTPAPSVPVATPGVPGAPGTNPVVTPAPVMSTVPSVPGGIQIIPPLPTPSPSVPVGLPSLPSLPALTPQPTFPVISIPIPAPPFVPIQPVPVPVPPTPPFNPNPNPVQPDFERGFYGQMCPSDQYASNRKCPGLTTSFSAASDRESGRLYCTQYDADCCLCSSITCGLGMFGTPCTEFFIGNHGIYGVGDVKVAGSLTEGAVISCYGTESCSASAIMATNVRSMDCKGDRSCKDASIRITDPFTEFKLYCSGKNACENLAIHIDFTGPPPGYMCAPNVVETLQLGQIECLNQESCQNMRFTMDNTGCYQVALRKIQCVHPTACTSAAFNLIGDIQVQECELGNSGITATGLDKCYENLREYQCTKPSSCMGLTKTILNPANGFEFKCGDISSCESAHFHFELNSDVPDVNTISGFVLGGRHSARGATFSFDNQQTSILDIDKIDCSGEGACAGARFITGPNVQIQEVTCSGNSCGNCRIQFDAADVGIPCDPEQVTGGGGGVWQQQPPWNNAPAPVPAAQNPGPWVAV